jgi:hypothetical protein
MAVIEPHKAEACAHTGHRLEPREGMGLVRVGGVQQSQLHVTEQRLGSGEECQVDREGRWHGRGVNARRDTRPGRVGGDVLADGRPVVLRVGL